LYTTEIVEIIVSSHGGITAIFPIHKKIKIKKKREEKVLHH